ncbi:phosphate propanoyltransferase [Thermanaerosceptrum fracticalcis]|uniref:Phosphate propanoyltransferase n=1 Tax=Thermanaerosceptrum fracticalcis TaxID=1712410 RepID=A0A7G6E7F4_THEFR|nr:phosphate propanoyltransferase [Thermanaerosceptrum fracticalcis]QNB48008.1 phosphate propanoyltransferase [Thermanaerosceptrum fracticalcis]
MDKEQLIRLVVEKIQEKLASNPPCIPASPSYPVSIGISNRHVHLSQAHVEVLFGPGYQLTPVKELQPGQFAAAETLTLVGPKGSLAKVRVLGPARRLTQVEISRTDGFTLGVFPPVRDSGFLQGTPGLVLVGPAGCLKITEGVICAARHIHFHPADAERMGIRDGDRLAVKIQGDRALVFDNVLARVNENYRLEMHIDTDEANAAGVRNGDTGILLLRQEGS